MRPLAAPFGFQTPITMPMRMEPISGYAAEMNMNWLERYSKAISVIMARAATRPTISPARMPRKRLNLQDVPRTQEMTSAMPKLHRNEMMKGQKFGCAV